MRANRPLPSQTEQMKLGVVGRKRGSQGHLIVTVPTPLSSPSRQGPECKNLSRGRLLRQGALSTLVYTGEKCKNKKRKILGHSQQLTSSDLSTQSWSPSHTHSTAMQRPSPQRCSFVGLQSGEKGATPRRQGSPMTNTWSCPAHGSK